MDFYAHINTITGAAVKMLVGDSAGRWLKDGPAAIQLFWNTNADLAATIGWLKVFSALISSVFIYIIVVAVGHKRIALAPAATSAVSSAPPTVFEATPVPAGALRPRWDQILAHLDSPQEAQWKVAVIEADKLVDDALARAGYSGGSFGDRLTNIAPGTLVSLDGLWWAHKVRNRLAHELDYFLRYTEARQAIGYYEQTLTELQLL